jgi:putative N6-adenine-specific DNA methylase
VVAGSSRQASLELFAICAPGLERLVAGELASLSLAPHGTDPGGVSFRGGIEAVWRANLWLRTASRVVVRLGSFRARALGELERHARTMPWDPFVPPGSVVRVRATAHKSRLYHTGAIAERVAGAIAARIPGITVATAAAHDDAPDGDAASHALVIVRIAHDTCLISADTSGELLHRRGYRLRTAKAPMRETLAAAMLLAGGWDPGAPLVDPLCGSGTIPIEAALIARRLPPGARRRFAFEHWPGFSAPRWRRVVDAALRAAPPAAPAVIHASDRDAGAIAAARDNADRAGVAHDIAFAQQPLTSVTLPDRPGWIVTNPPYGVRVGDRENVRDLYAQLGRLLVTTGRDWRAVVMLADRSLGRETGVAFRRLLRTSNGGIPVEVAARA